MAINAIRTRPIPALPCGRIYGERVLRSERFQGSLARSFTLASEIDEAGAVARYENGVLMLTLPKKTAVAARRISIN